MRSSVRKDAKNQHTQFKGRRHSSFCHSFDRAVASTINGYQKRGRQRHRISTLSVMRLRKEARIGVLPYAIPMRMPICNTQFPTPLSAHQNHESIEPHSRQGSNRVMIRVIKQALSNYFRFHVLMISAWSSVAAWHSRWNCRRAARRVRKSHLWHGVLRTPTAMHTDLENSDV